MAYLQGKGYSVIGGNARVDQDADVEGEIVSHQPTHVVSFTGRTHGVYKGEAINTIDYLEKPGMLKENLRDNLYGPVLLSMLSKKYGFHYTYLGTGCIFNYDATHPFEQETNGFSPTDEPNYFGSAYSVAKGYVDRLFHHTPVLNLRIRMPITAENNSRNFITKIAKYAKICSIKNSMTVLSDFFPAIEDMMNKRIQETVNLTNPGLISHNEILEMYKEIVDPSFTWANFTLEEQAKILLAERSNNYLDTSYIETNYPQVPNIKDSIRAVLHTYKRGLCNRRLEYICSEPVCVLVCACNNPEYIRMQHVSLRKHLGVPFQMVVFNDAKAWPDSTNFGDTGMRERISATCRELGVECVEVANDHHRYIDSASHRHTDTLRIVMRYVAEKGAGRYWMLDSDMFLVGDFAIEGYFPLSLVRQVRGEKEYAWPNLWMIDTRSVDVSQLSWDLAEGCDTGGASAPWLQKRRGQVRWISHLPSCQWGPEQMTDAAKTVSNKAGFRTFLEGDVRNREGRFWSELYEGTILHIRAGSNWNGEGRAVHESVVRSLSGYLLG